MTTHSSFVVTHIYSKPFMGEGDAKVVQDHFWTTLGGPLTKKEQENAKKKPS